MKFVVALFAVLSVPALAVAQDTTDALSGMPEINYNPGIAGVIFKLVISLVVIIGLIYLSIFLLKKISNKSFPNGNQLIKVVGRSSLTPKQSLYVVKMGFSYSVLGVSENSVNLIRELSTDEVESLQQKDVKRNGFQNVLKSVLKK